MLLTLLYLLAISTANAAVVETPLGRLEGTKGLSRDGRSYDKFLGVPYARPPTGKLRLKNPERLGKWEGVKNCTVLPQPCVQIPFFYSYNWNETVGVEDCLYLNVFSPDVKPKKLYPVMMYIHGGGFRCGRPGGENSGDYLVDEEVVFVNLNYRLGVLGFLSTEDETIPGNFGLKDQSAALRWVRENIAYFGGDPEKITLFGESAGAASTHFQMLAPGNANMLKGVISESGNINRIWTLEKAGQARPKAFRVAQLLGCEAETSAEILACLQTKDASEVTKAEIDFVFWQYDPFVVFKPVVEEKRVGAFMYEDPLTIENTIPWMTGVTTDEGLFRLSYLDRKPSAIDDFVQNIHTFLPRHLYQDEKDENVRESMELVKKRYFPRLDDPRSVGNGLKKILEDAFYYYTLDEAVKAHKGTKYLYLYSYKGANSLADFVSAGTEYKGVSHADELLMIFNWTEIYKKVKKEDGPFSRKVVKMWANFARHQNPTPDDGRWVPAENWEYFRIDSADGMEVNLVQEPIKFWASLPMYKKKVKSEL